MEFHHCKDEEKAANAHLLNRYLTTQLLKYINKSFNILLLQNQELWIIRLWFKGESLKNCLIEN